MIILILKIMITLIIILLVNIPTKNPVHPEGFVCDRLSLQILPL